jgi:hypothetical protein
LVEDQPFDGGGLVEEFVPLVGGVLGGRAGGAAVVVGGEAVEAVAEALVSAVEFLEEAAGPVEVVAVGADGDQVEGRSAVEVFEVGGVALVLGGVVFCCVVPS